MGAMRRSDKGQSMTEYALILVLVAVVCIGVLLLMGGEIKAIFTNVSGALAGH